MFPDYMPTHQINDLSNHHSGVSMGKLILLCLCLTGCMTERDATNMCIERVQAGEDAKQKYKDIIEATKRPRNIWSA